MPIWLRKFTFDSVKDFYERESKMREPNIVEDKKEYKKPNIDSSKLPNYKKLEPPKPYIAKAPTKK